MYMCCLYLRVFSECSVDIDIEKLVSNCKFDYCVAHSNNTVCSSLERLADHCKKMDFCVAWRDLTNGICGKPVLPACIGHLADVGW